MWGRHLPYLLSLSLKASKKSEDTKGVMRICRSKNRQHMAKRKGIKDKYITQKTKARAACTPLKAGCELRCSGRVGSSKEPIQVSILELQLVTFKT